MESLFSWKCSRPLCVVMALLWMACPANVRAGRTDDLRDDLKHVREQIRLINDELAKLQAEAAKDATAAGASAALGARSSPATERQARTQELNELKNNFTFKLQSLSDDIRALEEHGLKSMFPGTVDVFLTPAALSAGKPQIRDATLDYSFECGGRQLVKLNSPDATWVIDPTQVVAVRAIPATQPAGK